MTTQVLSSQAASGLERLVERVARSVMRVQARRSTKPSTSDLNTPRRWLKVEERSHGVYVADIGFELPGRAPHQQPYYIVTVFDRGVYFENPGAKYTRAADDGNTDRLRVVSVRMGTRDRFDLSPAYGDPIDAPIMKRAEKLGEFTVLEKPVSGLIVLYSIGPLKRVFFRLYPEPAVKSVRERIRNGEIEWNIVSEYCYTNLAEYERLQKVAHASKAFIEAEAEWNMAKRDYRELLDRPAPF